MKWVVLLRQRRTILLFFAFTVFSLQKWVCIQWIDLCFLSEADLWQSWWHPGRWPQEYMFNLRTCLTLEQPQGGTHIQTSLLVNDGCRNGPKVKLNVRVNYQTQCDHLLGMILIEKPSTTCSKAVNCDVMSSVIEEGQKVCGIKCQCADSAHQCLIHLVNDINVEICEIITTVWKNYHFWTFPSDNCNFENVKNKSCTLVVLIWVFCDKWVQELLLAWDWHFDDEIRFNLQCRIWIEFGIWN